jgi:hypothetical protein
MGEAKRKRETLQAQLRPGLPPLSSWGLFAVGETLLQNFTAHFGYGRRGLAA